MRRIASINLPGPIKLESYFSGWLSAKLILESEFDHYFWLNNTVVFLPEIFYRVNLEIPDWFLPFNNTTGGALEIYQCTEVLNFSQEVPTKISHGRCIYEVESERYALPCGNRRWAIQVKGQPIHSIAVSKGCGPTGWRPVKPDSTSA